MMERWPRAGICQDTGFPEALFKSCPEDFQVTELSALTRSGTGEHLHLLVEKVGLTTREAAVQLADLAKVPASAVGYAGMKDKRAVTRQWFSIPTSDLETPDDLNQRLAEQPLEVLESARHDKKLRRGQLSGNRFRITLRGLTSPITDADLALLKQGVPNYFGPQRFGRDNLTDARKWLLNRRKRRISHFKKGLYLSVLRSFIFNEVLAARVRDQTWNQLLDGDEIVAGVATGPLWGRGRTGLRDVAAECERAALAPHAELLEALEFTGLSQQRRPLVCRPEQLEWQYRDNSTLTLGFELPAGSYATVLLRELVDLRQAAEASSTQTSTPIQVAG